MPILRQLAGHDLSVSPDEQKLLIFEKKLERPDVAPRVKKLVIPAHAASYFKERCCGGINLPTSRCSGSPICLHEVHPAGSVAWTFTYTFCPITRIHAFSHGWSEFVQASRAAAGDNLRVELLNRNSDDLLIRLIKPAPLLHRGSVQSMPFCLQYAGHHLDVCRQRPAKPPLEEHPLFRILRLPMACRGS